MSLTDRKTREWHCIRTVSIIIWLALFLSLKHHAFTYYNIFKLMQYVVATLTY